MKKLCCIGTLALGLVFQTRADTVLVFNEIMYHPATNEPAFEWVEFYNQMAVDIDISNWRVSGNIDFQFPAGTRVPGRGFIVLAANPTNLMAATGLTNVFGPVTNRLSNGGGTLRLRNNSDRVVDEIDYDVDGDWPVTPDGSGVSLAKRDRDLGSAKATNWTASAQIGGTPGADNFPTPPILSLVVSDTTWKFDASGADLGTTWRGLNYNDSGWSSRNNLTNRSIPSLFNTGVDPNRTALADGAADPHYVLSYTAQGPVGANATVCLNNTAWLVNDASSKWLSVVNNGATSINTGGYGYQTTFSLTDFILSTVRINFSVAIDNAMTNVFINGTPSGFAYAGFAGLSSPFTLSSGFVNGVNTLEFGTENQGAGPGAFRATVSGTGLTPNTNAPLPSGNSTYYFRKSFSLTNISAFATLQLNPVVTDGAVFYLNGTEVYRQNLPGVASYSTPALSNVTALAYAGPISIAASNLVLGNNVLAVEVHQAAGSPDGPILGAELIYTALAAAPVALAFNELSSATNATFWLELMNYGTNAISLDGYVIRDDAPNGTNEHSYVFPAGVTLNAGGFLALTNTTLGFAPAVGDKLMLVAPNRSAVYDGTIVRRGPRARSPDGTGVWLVPNAPTSGALNNLVFRNEIVINEIMYSHKAFPSIATNIPPKDNPEAWVELYNRSTNTIDLTGWELDGGISYRFKAGRTIAPGAYLVVADDIDQFKITYPSADVVGNLGGKLSHSDDRVVLKDALGNPADEVHYYTKGRWPEYADGGGSSLELRDPNADNSKGEAWAASDESGKSSWQYFTYRGIAFVPPGNGQPTTWNDLVMGLLGAGECLIDDVSVIEVASTAQFIANGNFESGFNGWRANGTHGHSEVIVDPTDPGNHVLHVVATGPQEHMHNHIETTYTGGRTVSSGGQYQISYRAKWIAGNNLFNTRLYFNRLARTMEISYPQLNGTPGARNSRYAANVGPTFAQFQHQPVIPAVNQPVTVSVVAQDPQGVATCELWWSRNNGTWSNALMTAQGGGLYRGTIPGYASGNVQFYVRAVDGLGAAANYPADGTNSGALYAVTDGVANLTLGHNIRIIMTPSNVVFMHGDSQGVNQTNVMSNANIPCTVVVDETRAYYNVGVRLKGSQRGRYSDTRVSFHLEFPEDDPFRGVHPFMLIDRSGAGDSGVNKQQEILERHMLLRAGNIPGTQPDMCRVIAPRSTHTGSAILSPRHEDNFISTAFENGGDGTMWELELIYYPTTANALGYKLPQPDAVTGTDITDITPDKEYYRYNFIRKNHRDTDDYSRFVNFGKALSLSGAQLDAQTRQIMDVDEWMRVWALVSLCGVGDTYTFGNNHNLFMYARASDQKMLAFPTDMDFSFNRANNAALVGDQNLSKVINLPGNLRLFYGHITDIINTSYNSAYMSYWVPHYQSFAPGQDFSGVIAYINARSAYALGQIATAGGNSAFAVNAAPSMTGSNLVTLTGTAPVTMRTITVNGVEYPITWTSVSAWTMTVPISSPTNTLTVEGRDIKGTPLTNIVQTVVLTNPPPDPRGLIVFNEIMYNPAVPEASYIELFNTSSNTSFDLSGWRINGLDFTFPPGRIITPRQYLVVAGNAAAYAGAYGVAGGASAAEFLIGNLQNNGETLTLIKSAASSNEVDLIVDRVRYESVLPWSTNANGTGSALQLIDPNQENARVANWFSSYVPPVYCCGISTVARTNDGWQFISTFGSIGSGSGGGQFRLIMYLGTGPADLGTSALIDDLALVDGTNAAVGYNFIRNGDFELPLYEDPLLTNSWMVGTNYTNSLIVGSLRHGGAGALKMIPTTFGNSVTISSTTTNNRVIYQALSPAPVANSINTLSFWYWATNSSTNLTVRIVNSAVGTVNITTNINITYTPSNYVPPTLLTGAVIYASPGGPNQNASNLPPFYATNLPPFPPLWINEVQAENITGITDNRGERDPWIEIYNTSSNAVSLDGLFLSSSYTNLTNWAFPAGSSIGPTQFLVVFCDGQAVQTSNTEYHTSFRLPAVSGSVALSRLYSGGQAVLNGPQVLDYVNYAGLHSDKSYGSFPDGQPFDRQEFFYVTPRGTNDGRSAPLVVFINEWLASNVNGERDPADGAFNDWFELYNPGTNTVDLAGAYLTDALTNKFQFLITTNMAHTIPPKGYLLVWADNEPNQNTVGGTIRPDLHVNFALAKAGEQLGLFAADGTQIDAVTFGLQTDDVSVGRIPDGGANIVAMPGTASPRAPNYLTGSSNAAPTLDPIGDKTVYLGQTLTFTATAHDSDLPAQILTYDLVSAPAGATIGAGTGNFSWAPTLAGNYPVTVRVRDSGLPQKSAQETITVHVLALSFGGPVRRGTNLELTWGTQAGKKYAVDQATNLNTPINWIAQVTNTAPGTSLSYTNTTTNGPQKFFRIRTVD